MVGRRDRQERNLKMDQDIRNDTTFLKRTVRLHLQVLVVLPSTDNQ